MLAGKMNKLLPTQAKTVAWLGTEGHLGTGLTLHHQSFDPYGRYEMVQQHLNHNLSRASKQHQFCIRLAGKMNKLSPTRAKKVAWLGLAQKGTYRNWFDTASSLI
jgi:hypothetical protein